jgi:DNA-binding MarR family transcriptional regulator
MDKKKGMGEYQKRKMLEVGLMPILKVLIDEKEHRYKEIKEKGKLNDFTLSKHLKRLNKLNFVTKRIDIKSGKYPFPIYYKINPTFKLALHRYVAVEEAWKELEEKFLKDKDLWFAIGAINTICNGIFLTMIGALKHNKDLRDEEVNYLCLNLFVCETYETLMWRLLKASAKIVDDIDFEKLLKDVKKAYGHG